MRKMLKRKKRFYSFLLPSATEKEAMKYCTENFVDVLLCGNNIKVK